MASVTTRKAWSPESGGSVMIARAHPALLTAVVPPRSGSAPSSDTHRTRSQGTWIARVTPHIQCLRSCRGDRRALSEMPEIRLHRLLNSCRRLSERPASCPLPVAPSSSPTACLIRLMSRERTTRRAAVRARRRALEHLSKSRRWRRRRRRTQGIKTAGVWASLGPDPPPLQSVRALSRSVTGPAGSVRAQR